MLAEGVARVAQGAAPPAFVLERPKQARHGDYSTNVALQLAKVLKRNPRELAAELVAALPASPLLARAEVAGAGFVNLFVTDAARQSVVARIMDEGDRYGYATQGGGEKAAQPAAAAPKPVEKAAPSGGAPAEGAGSPKPGEPAAKPAH
jgi:arginyl-tRNA synthetase